MDFRKNIVIITCIILSSCFQKNGKDILAVEDLEKTIKADSILADSLIEIIIEDSFVELLGCHKSSVEYLKDTKTLRFHGCTIKEFPNFLYKFKSLKELAFMGCSLPSLPKLAQFEELEIVYFEHVNFQNSIVEVSDLPENLLAFCMIYTNLQKISFENNHIELLYLGNNHFDTLSLEPFNSLKETNLGFNNTRKWYFNSSNNGMGTISIREEYNFDTLLLRREYPNINFRF